MSPEAVMRKIYSLEDDNQKNTLLGTHAAGELKLAANLMKWGTFKTLEKPSEQYSHTSLPEIPATGDIAKPIGKTPKLKITNSDE
jgi:hypothetical protein